MYIMISLQTSYGHKKNKSELHLFTDAVCKILMAEIGCTLQKTQFSKMMPIC